MPSQDGILKAKITGGDLTGERGRTQAMPGAPLTLTLTTSRLAAWPPGRTAPAAPHRPAPHRTALVPAGQTSSWKSTNWLIRLERVAPRIASQCYHVGISSTGCLLWKSW